VRTVRLLLSMLSVLAFTAAGLAPPSSTPSTQTITITVDATEAPRKLFHAREAIPVSPGPLTLYYPKWIPGEHGPTGPITNLSGLMFTAGGKALPWRRDPVDMYAFHLDVPQGASALGVNLEFLAPTFAGRFTSGSSTTSHLAVLSWNWMLLYPRVAHMNEVMFTASLRLPPGWKFGTGLPVDQQSAGEVTFRAANLATLVDSPVLAGERFRTIRSRRRHQRPSWTSPPTARLRSKRASSSPMPCASWSTRRKRFLAPNTTTTTRSY
jgi:predicted metalloprotease with PDZ domain